MAALAVSLAEAVALGVVAFAALTLGYVIYSLLEIALAVVRDPDSADLFDGEDTKE